MKKTCSFILALVYLSFTVGATIHQHYCMSELVGTSLFDLKNKECGKCGMKKHTEESKNCCKDVSIVVKPGDSHTFSQPAYDLNFFSLTTPEIPFAIYDVRIKRERNIITYRTHNPPLLNHSLFLRFGNFRI